MFWQNIKRIFPHKSKKISVYLTREKKNSQQLANFLQPHVASTIIFPCVEIQQENADMYIKNVSAHFFAYNKFIFVSKNAVHYAMQYLRQYNIPSNLMLCAVGKGTAEALQQYGFNNIVYPINGYGGKYLLELAEFNDIEQQNIVIFKGKGGSVDLTLALHKKRAIITEVNVYKRICPAYRYDSLPDYEHYKYKLIVITSVELLLNLMTILNKKFRSQLLQTPILVVSQRIAQAAFDQGFSKVFVTANNNSNAKILLAIQKYAAQIIRDN